MEYSTLTEEQKVQFLAWLQLFFRLIPISDTVFVKDRWTVEVKDSGSFFFALFQLEPKSDSPFPFKIVATLPKHWVFYETIIAAMCVRFGWQRKDVQDSFFTYLNQLKKYTPEPFPRNYDDLLDSYLRTVFASEPPIIFQHPLKCVNEYIKFMKNEVAMGSINFKEEDFEKLEEELIANKPAFF